MLSSYAWYPCCASEYQPFLPNSVFTDLQAISVDPNKVEVVSNSRCCATACFCCMLCNCTIAGCCGTRWSKKNRNILSRLVDCLLCIRQSDVTEDVQVGMDIKRTYR